MSMMIPEPLQRILERIAQHQQTADDLDILRRSLHHDGKLLQWVSQDGKFNVNIGEIVGGQVHIGDLIYQGSDAEAIRQTVLELLEARKFRSLLTKAEFLDRLEQSVLTSYRMPLVGRDTNLKELQQALGKDNRVIVLHGSAGLGKTRLLVALSEVISTKWILWYVRNETESIELDLASLNVGTVQ
jgi:ATP-dependent Clp protease ATP-binding subunit ClpA